MAGVKRLSGGSGFFVALTATSVLAYPAHAEPYVLLQLGSASTQEQAQELSTAIKSTHASLLSRYAFYIRESQQVSVAGSAWRVQAGPVESKRKASRICAEIQSKGNDCFIIESAVPLEKVASATRQPEQDTAADTGQPSKIPSAGGSGELYSGSIWPWNWGDGNSDESDKSQPEREIYVQDDSQAENTSSEQVAVNDPEISVPDPASVSQTTSAPLPWLQEKSSGGGNVMVAEAIPVPLTQDKKPIELPPAPPVTQAPVYTPATPAPQRVPLNQWSNNKRSVRWLQVGLFSGSAAAQACWNDMQSREPSLSSMRAQIVQSAGKVRYAHASLRIGPLASDDAASIACGVAKKCDSSLSCKGIAEIKGSGQAMRVLAPSPSASNRRLVYGTPAAPSTRTPEPSGSGVYWVQLGSAASASQARQMWEGMKARYPDLFASRQAVVNVSGGSGNNAARAVYRVRTGSFKSREEASKLCASMTFRNLSCLVVAD